MTYVELEAFVNLLREKKYFLGEKSPVLSDFQLITSEDDDEKGTVHMVVHVPPDREFSIDAKKADVTVTWRDNI